MDTARLEKIAKSLASPGKGILAADSVGGIVKRMTAVGLTPTAELKRKFRELLLTTPQMEKYISGVILNDETVRLEMRGRSPMQLLQEKGVIPGIKVDQSFEPFAGTGEDVTKGLNGLEERLKEYSGLGLKFTKWRGVFKISDTTPSEGLIIENCERMAKFAKLSQENQLVPIVEPEVLLDGNHTTTRCEEVETKVNRKTFEKLSDLGVYLPGLIFKPSMVMPGKDNGVQADPYEIAQVTVRTLKNSVPSEIAGIVFLSGGQTEEEATANLREICKISKDAPWPLAFSFERALQNSALKIWMGSDENIIAAQEAFLARARANSEARYGR